jgi:hypothetical protein
LFNDFWDFLMIDIFRFPKEKFRGWWAVARFRRTIRLRFPNKILRGDN